MPDSKEIHDPATKPGSCCQMVLPPLLTQNFPLVHAVSRAQEVDELIGHGRGTADIRHCCLPDTAVLSNRRFQVILLDPSCLDMFGQICSPINLLLRCRSEKQVQLHISISLFLDQLHQSSQEQNPRSFDRSFLDFSPIDKPHFLRSLLQTHQMRKNRYQRIDPYATCH